MRIGPWEIVLLLLVVMLLFGPRRLPEIGRAFGRTIQEFRRATRESKDNDPDKEQTAPGDKGKSRSE